MVLACRRCPKPCPTRPPRPCLRCRDSGCNAAWRGRSGRWALPVSMRWCWPPACTSMSWPWGPGRILGRRMQVGPRRLRADRKLAGLSGLLRPLLSGCQHRFPGRPVPGDSGLIIADAYDAEILRMGPETPLAGARRKAMQALARHAALRLQALRDPAAALEVHGSDAACRGSRPCRGRLRPRRASSSAISSASSGSKSSGR